MKLSPEDAAWFDAMRADWLERIKPASTPLGQHVFNVPEKLEQAALEGARLFANRVEALGTLPRGGKVAEVGTQTGWFAEQIFGALGPDELHLFDLDFTLLHAQRPELAAAKNVILHLGDSSEVLSQLPNAYFDWIYVDGDHSLNGVMRDAAVAAQKIKHEGVLVFNDYTPWSIMEFIDYGVVPVVNKMLSNKEWKVLYLALHPHMYCDIALIRTSHTPISQTG